MARHFCFCACHGTLPVDVRDPLEAAVASGCSCLGFHAAIFLEGPPPRRADPDATGWCPPWAPDPPSGEDGG